MSKSESKKVNRPLLDIINIWLPERKARMTSLLMIENECLQKIVISQFEKIVKAGNRRKAARQSALDILSSVANEFRFLNNDGERRYCAALVCELVVLCLSLYEEWEVRDAAGDLLLEAETAGCYELVHKRELTDSLNHLEDEKGLFAALKCSLNPHTHKPNFYGPTRAIQELLKQRWFAEARADAKYDARWTDGFIEALMASEYGEGIARQWEAENKRNQLKAYVAGLLKDGGVLKGSYLAIANMTGQNNGKRTFSTNMSRGKKQPYADWVKEYIENH